MSFFDDAYRGTPPWDIGKPQTAFINIANKLDIKGPLFEVGCGTGENSLHFADLGYQVTGIDSSPRAIIKACQKAASRKLEDKVNFLTYDLFKLDNFGSKFSTIIDSGVFHMFDADTRLNYQANVSKILNPGGKLLILSFSYLEPLGIGPSQRLQKNDYFNTFKDGWKILLFDHVNFETRIRKNHAKGLLTIIERS